MNSPTIEVVFTKHLAPFFRIGEGEIFDFNRPDTKAILAAMTEWADEFAARVLDFVSRGDSQFAVMYGDQPFRFSKENDDDTSEDYTCEDMVELFKKQNLPMTQEEIKLTCEMQYDAIRHAEKVLADIRSACDHPNTFEGLYSYRLGSISPAIICSDCGTLIRYKY